MRARRDGGVGGKAVPTWRANCAFKRFGSEGSEKNRMVA